MPPTLLPLLLLSIRTTLFPSNARAPPNPSQPQTPDTGNSRSINLEKDSIGASPSLYPVALQTASESDHPSATQIRGAKRACASSIASLIPHQAALAIFAVPTATRGKDSNNATVPGASSRTQLNPAKNRYQLTEPLTSSPVSPATTALKPGAKLQTGLNRDYNPSTSGGEARATFTTPKLTTAGERNSGSSSASAEATLPLAEDASSGSSQGDSDECDQREQELLLSAIEKDVLDLCSDSYCNKHLMFAIVEAVLVKIIPELAEHGVAELMNERGL